LTHDDAADDWTVAEGVGLFRRGAYVYAMVSGSLWDSRFYHVYWIAAKTVPELAIGSKTRFVGRYTIPSNNQAHGHGAPILGPDGKTWYYVYHHLNSNSCCSRDVYVNEIEFIDRNDGRGKVHIRPFFPESKKNTVITQVA
jgi:hypothetical protein